MNGDEQRARHNAIHALDKKFTKSVVDLAGVMDTQVDILDTRLQAERSLREIALDKQDHLRRETTLLVAGELHDLRVRLEKLEQLTFLGRLRWLLQGAQ